ncbi:cation-translocating P-type ATPase C-terminal domain-containing protein, partial [Streptococcus oralis]|uniref:cation-translocating P-type ATPase C-terminal domain-containing protein n=1 Tax=Streptococcus oralis TaxID=1303 RepID=UPI002556AB3A
YIKATTMTLGAIVFSQIAHVINCRTEKVSVFKKGLFINPHIWTGILFEIILFIILTVTPGVQGIFNTGILGVSDWMMLCLIPIPLI